MAGIAIIGSCDVVNAFTGCDGAIVTADTAADDFVMIYCIIRNNPCSVDVAGFTQVAGINMASTLPRCLGTIMTGDTGFGCQTVVKRRYLPAGGHVTGVTSERCWHMCWTFARCNYSIVAALTSANDLRVIH